MSGGPIVKRGKTQFSSASEVTAARKKNVTVGYYNNNPSSQKAVPGSLYTSFLGGIKNVYGSPVNISAYTPSFLVNIPQPSVVTSLSSGAITPATTVEGVTTRVLTTASSGVTTTVSSFTYVTPGTTTYTVSQTIVSGTTGSSALFVSGPISYTYTSTISISPASGTATASGLTFVAITGANPGNSFNFCGVIGTTPLTGAAFASFYVSPVSTYPNLVVVGLTTSPGSFTGAGGNSSCIDYGMCPGGDNSFTSIRLYNKGGGNGFYNLGGIFDNTGQSVWSWDSTTKFAVAYDGTTNVNFYSNTTVIYSMSKTHGTTALVPMASFVQAGETVSGLTFGSNYGTTTVYNISTTATTFSNTTSNSFSVPSGKYATSLTTASAYAISATNTIVQASGVGEKQTLNMNVAKNAVINNPQ